MSARWEPYVLVALATAAVGVAVCEPSNGAGSDGPARPVVARLQVGEYLSARYLQRLEASLSPLEAAKLLVVSMVRVERPGGRIHLSPLFNFHEGGPEFDLDDYGTSG